MPKDTRSSSFDRSRASPYSRCYERGKSRRRKLPIGNEKDWQETRCPICMEHPHNAVLLLCSSREKGCIPYMCDTSPRHSNCLDQFRKSTANTEGEQSKLVCPLCRGEISGWTVIEPARQLMNSKTRSCSVENCDFSGNYSQLRNHARHEHPCVRPTEVNPEREREWTRLEEDMEQRDIRSMQLEFDGVDDGLMDGVYELASPNWNYDLDFAYSIPPFESEIGSFYPGLNWDSEEGSAFLEDWLSILAPPSVGVELQSREPGRSRDSRVELESSESESSGDSDVELRSTASGGSRGISRSRNRLLTRTRGNTLITRRIQSNDTSPRHNGVQLTSMLWTRPQHDVFQRGTGARRHRTRLLHPR